ncbi:MAG: hypothetical protein Kow0062_06640 [Acidobacteriota bacterium]
MRMLRDGREDELAAEAGRDARLLRAVVGRLWERDPAVSRAAARVFAAAVAGRPRRAADWMRRFLWALNDESGTNGAPVLSACEELARRAPDVVAPFLGCLARCAADPALRPATLAVFRAVAEGGAGPADRPQSARDARIEPDDGRACDEPRRLCGPGRTEQ